jgi:mannose-6-phosphate isomerase-like protein (cupin superfamily)
MAAQIVPVIMCSGAGTRLWPVSRESMPKQFVLLIGPESTFQQVLARVSDPDLFARPIVITSADFRFVVAEQLRRTRGRGRHRARAHASRFRPAAAVAAVLAAERDRQALVLVLAADHVVQARRVPRSLSARGCGRSRGPDRDLWHRAHLSVDELRLHPPRREAQRRAGVRGRSVRGKAGRRDRCRLRGGSLSLEQRRVKRIVVKPGSKLSLQKHFHRSEHWVVVKGSRSHAWQRCAQRA